MKLCSGTLALLSLALCLPVLAQDTANPSPSAAQPASVTATPTNIAGLSDIRIVRLSQVRGHVNIDRNIGRGYEEAFANIPITGGTRIQTDVGLAEVEFEDNSTFRLTPDTEVEFTLLKRTPTGSTISEINVLHGMVFAALANTKGNTFTIGAGKASVAMNPSSHIRLTMDGLNSNLSVLDGSVEFTDPFAATSTLTHKKSLDFDASGSKQPEFVKLHETAFDEWDKNGIEYQKQYSSLRSAGGAGMLYGTSDLNYYGAFVNMPGCGSLWQPYFVSAGWSPYDNGMWAYYPNVGYSWVSPYPWGWLPFHSGNWVNCGGAGWGWQPGGAWTGLYNAAAVAPGGGGGGNRTMVPRPLPPRAGSPAMVPVNTRPLSVSSVSAPGTFTFRKDSAGLGVPRDFGELKSISSDVAHHGMANTEIERSVIGPSPAYSHRDANGNMNGINGNRGAAGREISPGSRSVSTFSRAGAESRNGDMNAGWSGMPRDSMRGSEGNAGNPGNSPMSRQAAAPRPQSAPAPSAAPASSSSQGSAAGSRK